MAFVTACGFQTTSDKCSGSQRYAGAVFSGDVAGEQAMISSGVNHSSKQHVIRPIGEVEEKKPDGEQYSRYLVDFGGLLLGLGVLELR